MDSIKILKRAFNITLNYRALWVFGILLALTAGSFRGSGSNGGGGSSGRPVVNPNFPTPPGGWHFPVIPAAILSTIITIGLVIACLAIVIWLIFSAIRYVSEVAAIRMVDHYEATGEKVSVGQGFRWGWSRAALRLFAIDFLIHLVAFFAFLMMLVIAAAPLLLWLTGSQAAHVLGTVVAIGLVILVILIAILVSIVLALLFPFIFRACVLEDLGVMEALRRGVKLVRSRIEDVIVLGVILFALGFAWTVVMIVVVIVLLLVGGLLGGIPGLLVGTIASQFVHGAVPALLGIAVGLPIFIAIVALPLLFINGLAKVYLSTTWTLAYRELRALESAPVEPAPAE